MLLDLSHFREKLDEVSNFNLFHKRVGIHVRLDFRFLKALKLKLVITNLVIGIDS